VPRALSRQIIGGRRPHDVRWGTLGHVPPAKRPPKPHADDTEYRSAIFVAASHSADGNSYAKGEPIPESEYFRQVANGVITPERKVIRNRPPCPKCKGTGKRNLGGRQHKSHKWNCPCVACLPCKMCEGAGRIEVA
jgi:hypothetical protein